MTYKEQIASPKWQKRRLEIFARDNFSCCICGDTETELHVHHKKYQSGKKAWESPDDDLQTVCKWCHKAIEIIKSSGREIDILLVKNFIYFGTHIKFEVFHYPDVNLNACLVCKIQDGEISALIDFPLEYLQEILQELSKIKTNG